MRTLRAIALVLLALSGAALGFVLLVAGGALAVSHGWQRERVRSFAEARLSSALAEAGVRGELRVGSLVGPLYPTLGLRDVALVRDGVTLARIREVDVSLDLGSVYSQRRWIVSRLRLGDAEVSLAQDASGAWPWQGAAQGEAHPETESPAERPFALEIRELAIEHARLDATWIQAGKPSHLAGTLEASLHELVLPRAGDPLWPKQGQASLVVAPGMIGGRALLGAELAVELDGSRLRLAKSELDSTFGKLRLTGDTDLAGWLDPAAPASVHIEGEAAALDLAVLLARPELAGTVGGKLRVEATHVAGTELRDGRAEVSLVLAKSRIGRLAIADGELRGVYDTGKWRVERALLSSSEARLEAHGTGDLERIAALDVDLDVSDLAALAALVSSDTSGKARAKLRLSGAWRAPDGTLELETRELRVEGLELGSVKLRARSTGLERYRIEPVALTGPLLQLAALGPVLLSRSGDGVRIERARLRLGESDSIDLAGRVSASAVRELRVELAHVALAHLGGLARFAEPLGGHVSGTLTANGALPRPALAGHLTWDAPELGQVSAESIALDITTSAGVLRADGRIAARGQDLLRAKLAMPWSAHSDLSHALERPETLLEVSGSELDLALLQDLVPATLQRVEGKANVRLQLHGGEPEPTLSGELTIANASCEIPTLAQRFGPLDARLLLSRESLRVDSFQLHAGKQGLAELSGELRLANLRPGVADLELALRDFPIRWQTTLQTHAFGAVRLRGPLEDLVAQGALELRGLRYSLAGGTDPLLGEVRIRDSGAVERQRRAPGGETPEFWERMTVDVRIDIPSDGRVQGQGANLEIAGRLVAAKNPGGPLTVKGAIDTQHGSYRIRGKTFIVEQAHVEFTGRPDLDPDLDVRAMHRVRNILVYAIVRGRASAPHVQLSSDPPYPQDDVLALLLFGKTRDELSQQQAGALQSALAGSAGVAALESLSDQLGIDIPIDTVEVDDSGSSGTTLGVGGYLTENVFVRYGRGISSDSESNVRVDWRFRKRWSVETSVSTRGDSSADLVWTYDY
jgi:autotransporter translocation and assembly factor TamB